MKSVTQEDGEFKSRLFHGVPLGVALPYFGFFTVPDGYLYCDGTLYSSLDPTYYDLVAEIGGTNGMGSNNATTFSVTSGSTLVTSSSAHGLSVGDWFLSELWYRMTSAGFLSIDGLASWLAFPCRVVEVVSTTTFRIATNSADDTPKSSIQNYSGITWRDEFAVPDIRGRGIYGRDDMGGSSANVLTSAGFGASADGVGQSGGSQTHTLVESELPTFLKYTGHSSNTNTQTGGSGQRVTALSSANYGGGGAHANVGPGVTSNWIIRYKH